jgi:hypothetical protein
MVHLAQSLETITALVALLECVCLFSFRLLQRAEMVLRKIIIKKMIFQCECEALKVFRKYRCHLVNRVLVLSPVFGIGTPRPPHPQASMPPRPSGGKDTVAHGRRSGRVPIRTKGQTLWYSMYFMYFVSNPLIPAGFCNIIQSRLCIGLL